MSTNPTLFELSYPGEPLPEAVAFEGVVENGEVFTRRWIVDLILDLVGYTADKDLFAARAIEPACGSGAFLVPMVERLVESCDRYDRDITSACDCIAAYDLVRSNVAESRKAVSQALAAKGLDTASAESMAEKWVQHADYLTISWDESADFVIGNPPYVRLEAVPAYRQALYRSTFETMGGRADVFVGFYEKGLRSLKRDGKLAFICADRWMRNAYGKRLRALITREFSLDLVLTCHDVDAFEESVSAYPAITVLRRSPQNGTLTAEASAGFSAEHSAELVTWARGLCEEQLEKPGLTAAFLPQWAGGADSWPTGTPAQLRILADIERRFPPLEDSSTGTRVGIGVATGADSVFVPDDIPDVELSRLLPLAMTSDIRSGRLDWSGKYLVNPWDEAGLVTLHDYPKLARYYSQSSRKLRDRNIASRQPIWYRTIDRVTTSLTEKHKLLFADMAMRIWPVLDEGTVYPHHNLYWITSTGWDLEVLGGILLSDIAELFISSYCVKMRGGTLRFQAQYLRRIRVPRLDLLEDVDRDALRQCFRDRDTATASEIASRLYGVALNE